MKQNDPVEIDTTTRSMKHIVNSCLNGWKMFSKTLKIISVRN